MTEASTFSGPTLELLVGDHVQPIERVLVRTRRSSQPRSRSGPRRAARHSPCLPSRRRWRCRTGSLRSAGRAPGREPGLLRRRLGGLRGLGQEGVDGRPQPPGGQRVVIHGRRHVAIGREHRRSADGGSRRGSPACGREQGARESSFFRFIRRIPGQAKPNRCQARLPARISLRNSTSRTTAGRQFRTMYRPYWKRSNLRIKGYDAHGSRADLGQSCRPTARTSPTDAGMLLAEPATTRPAPGFPGATSVWSRCPRSRP